MEGSVSCSDPDHTEADLSDLLKRDTSLSSPDSTGMRGWLNSPAFPVVMATIGCLPLLIVHFQQLWVRPHYQYFPMVMMAVGILYQLRRTDPDREAFAPRPYLAGLGLLAGLALATYAVLRISPLMCCAGWLLAATAFVARNPVNAWSQWALLWLLLRLPQGRDLWLIHWLQKITTRISSGVLDHLQIDHLQQGNVLAFPDRKLFVEEACSGVVSLFTILATAAIFGAFLRRSAFHTLLLMLAGAFWAGAANILRVVAIAVSIEKMGIDLTEGWPHTILGMVVFSISLLVLFSTDALLRFIFGPIEFDDSSASESSHENPLISGWNRLFWPTHERPASLLGDRTRQLTTVPGAGWRLLVLVTSAGFLSLGAFQVWGGIGPFSSTLGVEIAIDNLSKESLPPQLVGWSMTNFQRETRSTSSEFGARSRQWTYTKGALSAVVSIDYPFPDWHDLDVCYRGVGWTVSGWKGLPDESTARQHILRNDQQSGLLIYDLFDQNGAPHQPPSGQGLHPRWGRLLSGESSRWTMPTFYQVQALALVPSLEPIDPQSISELQSLFVEFRKSIREQASQSIPKGKP